MLASDTRLCGHWTLDTGLAVWEYLVAPLLVCFENRPATLACVVLLLCMYIVLGGLEDS